MMQCQWIKNNGQQCARDADQGDNYCFQHPPGKTKTKDDKSVIDSAMEEANRYDEYRDDKLGQIISKIGDVTDLKSLQEASLEIIKGLAEGVIDPKAGSAVMQGLKHQEVLIGKLTGEGDKLDSKSAMQIMIHIENMNLTDAWALFAKGDDGLAMLAERMGTENTIDVTPAEVPLLEDNEHGRTIIQDSLDGTDSAATT